ncbi:class I SAM-dependent methyltransferase [Candidatus Amesbacteria bacterium]|nr:class I SAM-dependent methyltransferase [Candidatus Amesbacteria bacterium]
MKKKKKISVVGVDISENVIKMCKQNSTQFNLNYIDFICSGKVPQKIKKLKFDLIICSEVIEHVDADVELIRELANLLNDNGLIIITTPSINAPLYKMGLLNKFDKRVGHLRRYTEEELLKKIKLSGLKIISLYKREGILRNSLFNLNGFGWIIRFIRGPMINIVSYIDMLTVGLFGESDLQVIAQKL